MAGKQTQISERFPECLDLATVAPQQDKIRRSVTILPETLEWLERGGNVSGMIDNLVALAKNKGFNSEFIQNRKVSNGVVSTDVFERMNELTLEIHQLRSRLAGYQAAERSLLNQICQCHSDSFRAADILKAALKLRSDSGNAIKEQIRNALEVTDNL